MRIEKTPIAADEVWCRGMSKRDVQSLDDILRLHDRHSIFLAGAKKFHDGVGRHLGHDYEINKKK